MLYPHCKHIGGDTRDDRHPFLNPSRQIKRAIMPVTNSVNITSSATPA